MKKFLIISLIFSLILFTAIIKNSTKKIDEEIFSTKETLTNLSKEFENIKLEFEYLSSAKKLYKFKNLFFDEELVQKEINEIKTIKITTDQIIINQLRLTDK
jgi:hypothetical protein